MKLEHNELSGLALDWAVTLVKDPEALRFGLADWREQRRASRWQEYPYRWSASWSQGGEIIEGEHIDLAYFADDREWSAFKGDCVGRAPAPLTAAMRAYVAFYLGKEVDVPEELL